MRRTLSKLHVWLATCFMSVVLVGMVYVAVQQNYREDANDPQIQLAEDTAAALNAGRPASGLVSGEDVDMGASLAPFVIITDQNRHVLASSGQLNGRVPLPPAGSFEQAAAGKGKYTDTPHENRITWQPTAGVREAAVIVSYHGGYVVAARSLREVEGRESQLTLYCAAALAVLLAGLSAIFWFA
jgi:hypothetical protein